MKRKSCLQSTTWPSPRRFDSFCRSPLETVIQHMQNALSHISSPTSSLAADAVVYTRPAIHPLGRACVCSPRFWAAEIDEELKPEFKKRLIRRRKEFDTNRASKGFDYCTTVSTSYKNKIRQALTCSS